jgi:hypothetical protein
MLKTHLTQLRPCRQHVCTSSFLASRLESLQSAQLRSRSACCCSGDSWRVRRHPLDVQLTGLPLLHVADIWNAAGLTIILLVVYAGALLLQLVILGSHNVRLGQCTLTSFVTPMIVCRTVPMHRGPLPAREPGLSLGHLGGLDRRPRWCFSGRAGARTYIWHFPMQT